MSDRVRVRLATPGDADVIAWHRARMFQEMGRLPPDLIEPLRSRTREHLLVALETEEYVGWLASAKESPVNVFTEPGWRRQGLAGLLMGHILMRRTIDRTIVSRFTPDRLAKVQATSTAGWIAVDEPTGWVAWGLGSQLRFCLTKPGAG
jgi:GNAT superfamily N-acetyltransferase